MIATPEKRNTGLHSTRCCNTKTKRKKKARATHKQGEGGQRKRRNFCGCPKDFFENTHFLGATEGWGGTHDILWAGRHAGVSGKTHFDDTSDRRTRNLAKQKVQCSGGRQMDRTNSKSKLKSRKKKGSNALTTRITSCHGAKSREGGGRSSYTEEVDPALNPLHTSRLASRKRSIFRSPFLVVVFANQQSNRLWCKCVHRWHGEACLCALSTNVQCVPPTPPNTRHPESSPLRSS